MAVRADSPIRTPKDFEGKTVGYKVFPSPEYLAILKANGVDLATTKLQVGRLLTFNPKTEKCVGDEEANKLLTREYRKPFTIPETF